MGMSKGCANSVPPEVCKVCFAVNGVCTRYCLDSFVYDERISDKDKIQILRTEYREGGNNDGISMGVIIPDRLKAMLAKS